MVDWNVEQREIIRAAAENRLGSLNLRKRYKCLICHFILTEDMVETLESGKVICKTCKQPVSAMCALDHCHCSHDVVSGLIYCPVCNEAICPECGSHDVEQISRVTGYLQAVSGWNPAKQQELKDRVRCNLVGTDMIKVDRTKA